MDQSVVRPYCVPVSEAKQGESAIYRNIKGKDKLLSQHFPDIDTLQKWQIKAFKTYGQNNSIGTLNPTDNTYSYITYDELHKKSLAIGGALVRSQLVKTLVDAQNLTIKPVGVYSRNRAEWIMVDVACQLYGLTVVPFYDTLGPASITYGLNITQLTLCFCSAQNVENLAKAENLQFLKHIVSFDDIPEPTVEILKSRGIQLMKFHDFIQGDHEIVPYPEVTPDTPVSLCFTSGTTGDVFRLYYHEPKAAVQTNRNFVALLSNGYEVWTSQDVHLSYLPMAHTYERMVYNNSLIHGNEICISSGNILNLREDILRARPTVFASVPRVYNRFYQAIKQQFAQLPEEVRQKVEQAVQYKLDIYRKTGETTNEQLDSTVFAKTKAILGGRQRFCLTGSAPIGKEVLDFLKVVLCCPILEGYGQTESLASGFATDFRDSTSDHLGACSLNLEVKFVDIPEMEYYSTDKDAQGNLTPRGEICLRGPTIMAGYFAQPEKTQETIDADGWLHTGDVGLLQADGTLKIIDRKKNIFKLAQGEYVSPEKIENLYLRNIALLEIFVHGDSLKNSCVAIVGLDPTVVAKQAEEMQLKGSFEELCKNPEIKQRFLQLLTNHAVSQNLLGFEQVKNIYLESRPFATLGILTDTMKLQRFVARKVYTDIINQLYLELNE